MQILAFFTSNGSPAAGLSPTIRIREIPAGTLVITDAAMTEIGDGSYSYNFTGYSVSKDYAIRCDGGSTLTGSERYTYAGNENYVDDIDWTIGNYSVYRPCCRKLSCPVFILIPTSKGS